MPDVVIQASKASTTIASGLTCLLKNGLPLAKRQRSNSLGFSYSTGRSQREIGVGLNVALRSMCSSRFPVVSGNQVMTDSPAGRVFLLSQSQTPLRRAVAAQVVLLSAKPLDLGMSVDVDWGCFSRSFGGCVFPNVSRTKFTGLAKAEKGAVLRLFGSDSALPRNLHFVDVDVPATRRRR